MRMRFRARALLAATALAIAAAGVIPVAGQAPAYRAPRTADGKPNLNGIWQTINEADSDIEGHSAAPGRGLATRAEDAVVPGLGSCSTDRFPICRRRRRRRRRISKSG